MRDDSPLRLLKSIELVWILDVKYILELLLLLLFGTFYSIIVTYNVYIYIIGVLRGGPRGPCPPPPP